MAVLPAAPRPAIALVSLFLTIAFSSCIDFSDESVTGPPPDHSSEPTFDLSTTSISRRPQNIHQHFLELAREIPGFAGMYFDSTGTMVVGIAEESSADRAHEVVRALARSDFSPTLAADVPIRTNSARFSYEQLAEWYASILSAPLSTTMTGIDERLNQIIVGVAEVGDQGRVTAVVRELGIPSEAIVVDAIPPLQVDTDLDDQHTLVGGLQVEAYAPCTLGYNVRLRRLDDSLDPRDYFLVNSHCTDTFAVNDGTVFGQPTISHRVGEEIADPPIRIGTGAWWDLCPLGISCRESDAALVRVDSGVASYHGRIAVTSGQNLTITGFKFIHDIHGVIYTGTVIHKVGRTTGTTSGAVLNSCANAPTGASSMLVCQVIASYHSGGGDSGSPVYYIDGQNRYWVLGMHWGHDGLTNNRAFSPWSAIEAELNAEASAVLGSTHFMEVKPLPPALSPTVSITSFIVDSYEVTLGYSVNTETHSIAVHRQIDGGPWSFVENRNVAPGSSGVLYVVHYGSTGERVGIRLTPYDGSNGSGNDGIPAYRWDDIT